MKEKCNNWACSYNKGLITSPQNAVRCPKCKAVYHSKCWDEIGICLICGSNGKPLPEIEDIEIITNERRIWNFKKIFIGFMFLIVFIGIPIFFFKAEQSRIKARTAYEKELAKLPQDDLNKYGGHLWRSIREKAVLGAQAIYPLMGARYYREAHKAIGSLDKHLENEKKIADLKNKKLIYDEAKSFYKNELNNCNFADLEKFGGNAWHLAADFADTAENLSQQPEQGTELFRKALLNLRIAIQIVNTEKKRCKKARLRAELLPFEGVWIGGNRAGGSFKLEISVDENNHLTISRYMRCPGTWGRDTMLEYYYLGNGVIQIKFTTSFMSNLNRYQTGKATLSAVSGENALFEDFEYNRYDIKYYKQ